MSTVTPSLAPPLVLTPEELACDPGAIRATALASVRARATPLQWGDALTPHERRVAQFTAAARVLRYVGTVDTSGLRSRCTCVVDIARAAMDQDPKTMQVGSMYFTSICLVLDAIIEDDEGAADAAFLRAIEIIVADVRFGTLATSAKTMADKRGRPTNPTWLGMAEDEYVPERDKGGLVLE